MRIGFIGGGNMASALVDGFISAGVESKNITLFDTDLNKCKQWSEKDVAVASSVKAAEDASDLIIFAVKPNVIDAVLAEIKGDTDKIYLSIAAGISLAHLEEKLGADKKIIRTMPNTPAQCGCGMTVITPNKNITDSDLEKVRQLLEGVGDTEVMDERFMSIATALHGSSPAYVYMLIDAMADAGVSYGLTKAQALHLASKAVEGSAKMVLESGLHPEQLKDNVCSPGGTTIMAVCELEKNGFRGNVQGAVKACVDASESLSR